MLRRSLDLVDTRGVEYELLAAKNRGRSARDQPRLFHRLAGSELDLEPDRRSAERATRARRTPWAYSEESPGGDYHALRPRPYTGDGSPADVPSVVAQEKRNDSRYGLERNPAARVGLRHRLPVRWRVEGAGEDGVDPDAMLEDLGGSRPCERDDSRLGGGIRGGARARLGPLRSAGTRRGRCSPGGERPSPEAAPAGCRAPFLGWPPSSPARLRRSLLRAAACRHERPPRRARPATGRPRAHARCAAPPSAHIASEPTSPVTTQAPPSDTASSSSAAWFRAESMSATLQPRPARVRAMADPRAPAAPVTSSHARHCRDA